MAYGTSRICEGVSLAQAYIAGNFDPGNGVTIEGGHIKLPERLGLGVVPTKPNMAPGASSVALQRHIRRSHSERETTVAAESLAATG